MVIRRHLKTLPSFRHTGTSLAMVKTRCLQTLMSINRWMDKEDVVCIYNGILLSHEKEWNHAIRSNMDGPRECHTEWSKSDREGEILFDIPYIWTLRRNDTNELTEQKQTHWLREQGYSCCREGWGEEIGWDGHVHSTIFKMDNQQGPFVLHMELCSMLCGSLDGKGVWRRMGTYYHNIVC